jgi:hypothetical protein
LKQIVDADPDSAAVLLEAAEITMLGDNIESVVDDEGNHYSLPVFILNDPQSFQVDEAARVIKETTANTDTINLAIRLAYSYSEKDFQCTPAVDTTVAELKLLYKEQLSVEREV